MKMKLRYIKLTVGRKCHLSVRLHRHHRHLYRRRRHYSYDPLIIVSILTLNVMLYCWPSEVQQCATVIRSYKNENKEPMRT